MTPERIEELAKSVLRPLTKVVDHPSARWNPRAWHVPQSLTFEEMEQLIKSAIITAINETKEEDSDIAIHHFSFANYPEAISQAILASKLKE
ncbi:MAG TPA: hypothetical protein VJ742_00770 [Nitrososphaera sp.]|nr:hypothetical protein [Nitrososphaera sp.]